MNKKNIEANIPIVSQANSHPKQKKPFALTIGITLALLTLAGWYLLSKKHNTKMSSVPNVVSISQAPQPTVKSDETASWKTYNSPQKGISFKYPNDWKLTVSKDEYTKNTYAIIKGPNNFILSYTVAGNDRGFYIGYVSHSSELNIPNYGKLFVTYSGMGTDKKVSAITLLENKYSSGFSGNIIFGYPSKNTKTAWIDFAGAYSPPNSEVSLNFTPDEFSNKPEVKIAEKIFSTLTYEK